MVNNKAPGMPGSANKHSNIVNIRSFLVILTDSPFLLILFFFSISENCVAGKLILWILFVARKASHCQTYERGVAAEEGRRVEEQAGEGGDGEEA